MTVNMDLQWNTGCHSSTHLNRSWINTMQQQQIHVGLTVGFVLSVLAGDIGILSLDLLQLIPGLLTFGLRLGLGVLTLIQPGLQPGQLLLHPVHPNSQLLKVPLIFLLICQLRRRGAVRNHKTYHQDVRPLLCACRHSLSDILLQNRH